MVETLNMDDFKNLKCSNCSKYLSIPPIYTSDDNKFYRCGRCKDSTDEEIFSRCLIYEQVAKIVSFPCSISVNCPKKLKWNDEVAKHEKECPYKKFYCPFPGCSSVFELLHIDTHFEDRHDLNMIQGDRVQCKINLQVNLFDTNGIFLLKWDNCLFLLYYKSYGLCSLKGNTIIFNVFKILPNEENHTFWARIANLEDSSKHVQYLAPVLQLTTDDNNEKINSMNFSNYLYVKKNDIRSQIPGNVHHLQIILFNSKIETDKLYALSCEQNEYRNFLKTYLQCPICLTMMKNSIRICQLGHSVCEKCRSMLTRCPTCRQPFSVARNFLLESIFKEFRRLSMGDEEVLSSEEN